RRAGRMLVTLLWTVKARNAKSWGRRQIRQNMRSDIELACGPRCGNRVRPRPEIDLCILHRPALRRSPHLRGPRTFVDASPDVGLSSPRFRRWMQRRRLTPWRGVRVAEGARLESVCGGNLT